MRKHGKIIDDEIKMKRNKKCKVEGCDGKRWCWEYCNKHYLQMKKYGRLTPELEIEKLTICKVEGCNEKIYRRAQVLCKKITTLHISKLVFLCKER